MVTPEIVIYTCIVGKRDYVKNVRITNSRYKYIVYSDSAVSVKGWEYRPLQKVFDRPVLTARYHKHNPHLLFSEPLSIWIDGSHWMYNDVYPWVETEMTADIACMLHHSRDNVYQEAEAVIDGKLDDPIIVNKQLDRYKYLDLSNSPLFETSCLIRKHTKRLAELQNLWWSEISTWSVRDQLSFNYSLEVLDMTCDVIPGYCRKKHSDYFHFASHYRKEVPYL